MNCNSCYVEMPKYASICPVCDTPVLDKAGIARTQQNGYNRYGISREIKQSVKDAVRRECGYGCVICGNMIVQIDHFDPEFSELRREHEASGLTLLCPNCHERKKGNSPELTNAMISEYRKNPYARMKGKGAEYSNLFLRPGPKHFRVSDFRFEGKEICITTAGRKLLSISPPSDSDLPMQIDLQIYALSGKRILEIENNCLRALGDGEVDIEVVQSKAQLELTYQGSPLLHLDRSDTSVLHILGLQTWHAGYQIKIDRIGAFVNNRLKLGGGDCLVSTDGRISIDLVKMYGFVGEKSKHLM